MDVTTIDPLWWIVLGVVVVLVLVGIALVARNRRTKRSDRLRRRFRSEYDRTTGIGRRRDAEADLERRLTRRGEVDLSELGEADADEIGAQTDELLREFVDGPEGAARGMVQLVGRVAVARGYVATEEGVLDLVSVDHPEQVAALRHRLSEMDGAKDAARTEVCRQVCLDARTLTERLLAEGRAGQLPPEDAGTPAPDVPARTPAGTDDPGGAGDRASETR
jgi:hypothetical protein